MTSSVEVGWESYTVPTRPLLISFQVTVETATFGSEYVAARTCSEQILDIRSTFRYLGVPIEHATVMLGDNESVVNTASMPHSKLNTTAFLIIKRDHALLARYYDSPISGTNKSDILSKHWDMASVWQIMRPSYSHWEKRKIRPLMPSRCSSRRSMLK
jgi:hypothetical protein